MIKAIIFDCFGVLTREGWHAFSDDYLKKNPAMHKQALKLHDQVNRGQVKYEDFLKQLSTLTNTTPQIISKYLDENPPNKPLLTYIKNSLKPKFKIGILSNAGDNWLSELFVPAGVFGLPE